MLPDKFRVGRLEVDLAAYRLLRDGVPIRLTRTEWALLLELARHHGQVLTYRALLQGVWGAAYGDENDYIHTYIRRLRVKLEDDPAQPQYILTEAGIGYRLEFFFNGEPVVPPAASVELAEANPQADVPRRLVNALPLDMGERFIGRTAEQAALTAHLLANSRLVTVVGRSGVGKTALVCKVLSDARVVDAFDGVVVLSADRVMVNLGRIAADFATLIADETLEAAVRTQPGSAHRVTMLLNALMGGRYLLLVDNFEVLQHPLSGDIADPDLAALFTLVLQQGGGLSLLVTSRLPLALPRHLRPWEQVVALDAGLPADDALALLRGCDSDGSAGLRAADSAVLLEIVARTGGFPRALEATAGLLLDNQLLTVADVLADAHLFEGEIGSVIVQNALGRLDVDAMRVMQALAVYERPVTMEAVAFLLEPFATLTSTDLRTILNRLVRSFFCIYDRESGLFSLHSIDRAYCYGQIPVTGQSFTVEMLHRRAAAYYAQTGKAPAQWKVPGDIDSAQQQFLHLRQAGDDDDAARLLLDLSPAMLMWGQLGDLRRMHEGLLSRAVDDDLRRQQLILLATVCRLMGQTRLALEYGQQALDSSRAAADAVAEGGALAQLGWTDYDLAQFEPAMTHWNRALSLFRQRGDVQGEGEVLGGLGWVSYLRGDYDAAVDCFRQAWDILIKLGDLYRAGMNLGDLGLVRMAQGRIDEAISILTEALSFADRLQAPREKSYKHGYLATALLLKDELTAAYEVIAQVDQFDVPGNQFFIAALEGIILARLGRTDEAAAAFERAIRLADRLLTHNDSAYPAYYGRGLARAGLTLLADGSPARALHDYERARRLCSERGILSHQRLLLDALMRCDHGERLSPLVAALAV